MGTCKLYTVPVAVYRVGMCATPHTPQGGFPSLSLYLGSRPAGPRPPRARVLCGRVKYSTVHAPSTVIRIRKLACGRWRCVRLLHHTLLSSKLCFER